MYNYYEVKKANGERIFNIMCKRGYEFKDTFNKSIEKYCSELDYKDEVEVEYLRSYHE